MAFLKVLLSIIFYMFIYLFGYSSYSTIQSIIKGDFDYVALICVFMSAAVIAIISFFEIKGKKKTKVKTATRVTSRDAFQRKYEGRLEISKKVLAAAIASGVLYLLSLVSGIIYVSTHNEVLLKIFFMGSSTTVPPIIILVIIYSKSMYPVILSRKIIEMHGLTLDSCLDGMESAPTAPDGQIICTDKAIICQKKRLVIPYSSILWIYKSVFTVNGIAIGEGGNLYTDYGNNYGISTSEANISWILQNFRSKLPKELVLGYGHKQKKAYKKAKRACRQLFKKK